MVQRRLRQAAGFSNFVHRSTGVTALRKKLCGAIQNDSALVFVSSGTSSCHSYINLSACLARANLPWEGEDSSLQVFLTDRSV
jgi:hypothetical protein